MADTPFQQSVALFASRLLPAKEAALLAGIVVGAQDNFPDNFVEILRKTGTIHIVVASGSNITLLAIVLLSLLALFLKRRLATYFLLGFIWFYAFLTGFQPPIIRASVMISLIYLGQGLGRVVEAKRILFLAAGIMFLFRPSILSAISFQLSFASVAGLLYLQPKLKTQKGILSSEAVSATLACQLATLPLMVNNFGQVNLFSVFANMLVLWTVPMILGVGSLIVIFRYVAIELSEALAYLLLPILMYFILVVETVAKITIFQIWLPGMGIFLTIFYYLVILAIFF